MTFGPLVSGEWLADHAAQVRTGDVRIVDVRWYLDGRSGRAAFEGGHISLGRSGSIWTAISRAPASRAEGRHPLLGARALRGRTRRGSASPPVLPVVAYDDAGGSVAARLWWLLHVLGEPVAVLDGGIDRLAARELSTFVNVCSSDRT